MEQIEKFTLYTDEYEQGNIDLFDHLPNVKIKYRNTINFNGQNYNYDDLSKVKVLYSDNKYIIEPLIFSTDKTKDCIILDFAGLYIIGVMEIMLLVINRDINMYHAFVHQLNKSLHIFDDLDDFHDILNQINYSDIKISESNLDAFNILFTMKTNYSKLNYDMCKFYMNVLFIVWLKNKQIFWQIFFEIMNYCKPEYIDFLRDNINNETEKILKIVYGENTTVSYSNNLYMDWLDENIDLHFEKIEYITPNNTKKDITDCRGVSIYLSLKFYLQILTKFGYVNKECIITNYTSPSYITYLDEKINQCIGNDNQSKVLRGVNVNKPIRMSQIKTYINNDQIRHYNINDFKINTDFYEDCVLYIKAYFKLNSNEVNNYIEYISEDINMNYFTLHNLSNAIFYICNICKDKLLNKDTQEIEEKLKSLQNKINTLKIDNDQLKEKTKEQLNEITKNMISIDEYNKLSDELNQMKILLESKNNTIEQLTNKNKELNIYIENISSYSEEDIEEELKENQVAIEEMIDTLNCFKFCLLGGRMELIRKLQELGWYNVIQYAKDNRNKANKNSAQSDFYVVNTKFISHNLVEKIEKTEDLKDNMLYFNGTNIEQLIFVCYKFVQNYLDN